MDYKICFPGTFQIAIHEVSDGFIGINCSSLFLYYRTIEKLEGLVLLRLTQHQSRFLENK